MSIAWPGWSVVRTANVAPSSRRKARSYVFHRRRMRPFAEAGFTMKTMSAAMVDPKSLMGADEVFVRADLCLLPRRIPAQDSSNPFPHHHGGLHYWFRCTIAHG